jgi:hypothetical protein
MSLPTALTPLLLCALVAQQTSVTVTRDLHGRPVAGPQIESTDGQRTELLQSINGRLVPVERVEERILREDASGRVVERIVRKYDANGNPGTAEKTLIEEDKSASGSTIRTTTFRSDVNGRFEPAERSLTQSAQSGGATTTETLIERPNLNGGFQAVERRSTVAQDRPGGKVENTVVYRPDGGGRFVEARRETREEIKQGDQVTVNAAAYEPDALGRLALRSQTVERSVKNPDGSVSLERDLYRVEVPGVAGNLGGAPRLIEQQLIDRKPAPGGVVESFSVRRPSSANPNALGAPEKLAETVCKGKCDGK